jgi:hypothetical protein
MAIAQRIQLNVRFDGRKKLLQEIRETAKKNKLSVNAWIVKTLERAIRTGTILVSPIAPEELETNISTIVETLKNVEAQIIAVAAAKVEPENKATVESVYALRQELRIAYGQLARQDRELLALHEQNRKLRLELSETSQSAIEPEAIKSQPTNKTQPNATKIENSSLTNTKHDFHKKVQAGVSIR